jgi:hypothetical protein
MEPDSGDADLPCRKYAPCSQKHEAIYCPISSEFSQELISMSRSVSIPTHKRQIFQMLAQNFAYISHTK